MKGYTTRPSSDGCFSVDHKVKCTFFFSSRRCDHPHTVKRACNSKDIIYVKSKSKPKPRAAKRKAKVLASKNRTNINNALMMLEDVHVQDNAWRMGALAASCISAAIVALKRVAIVEAQ
jgi:hypothetical protein